MARKVAAVFDRYQRHLAPPDQPPAERIEECRRIAGDIHLQLLQCLQSGMLEDKRAEELWVKVGALEAHLIMAHNKANDLNVALDALKG